MNVKRQYATRSIYLLRTRLRLTDDMLALVYFARHGETRRMTFYRLIHILISYADHDPPLSVHARFEFSLLSQRDGPFPFTSLLPLKPTHFNSSDQAHTSSIEAHCLALPFSPPLPSLPLSLSLSPTSPHNPGRLQAPSPLWSRQRDCRRLSFTSHSALTFQAHVLCNS